MQCETCSSSVCRCWEGKCRHCKRVGSLVRGTEGLVCGNCGVSAGIGVIHEGTDHRTFADESDAHKVHAVRSDRTEQAIGPVTKQIGGGNAGAGSGTGGGAGGGAGAGSGPARARFTAQQKRRLAEKEALQEAADRLRLSARVKGAALDLLAVMRNADPPPKRLARLGTPDVVAAMLFAACRAEKVGIQLKKIVAVCGATSTSNAADLYRDCRKNLRAAFTVQSTTIVSFVERFGAGLGLPNIVRAAAMVAADALASHPKCPTRKPSSLAAGLLYAVAALSDTPVPMSRVVAELGVGLPTVRGAMEDMYGLLRDIVPTTFASLPKLRALPLDGGHDDMPGGVPKRRRLLDSAATIPLPTGRTSFSGRTRDNLTSLPSVASAGTGTTSKGSGATLAALSPVVLTSGTPSLSADPCPLSPKPTATPEAPSSSSPPPLPLPDR